MTRRLARLAGTVLGVTIGSLLKAVAPSKPPKGVLVAGSAERSCTPICDAAFEAVYGEALADWAREVAECADEELAEMSGWSE